VEGGVTRQLLGHAVVHGGRSALPSRCTMQISLYLEERLTRMITVMEIIELSSIFEVHRSRFKGGALQVNLTSGAPINIAILGRMVESMDGRLGDYQA
jgi:hypothetical protein